MMAAVERRCGGGRTCSNEQHVEYYALLEYGAGDDAEIVVLFALDEGGGGGGGRTDALTPDDDHLCAACVRGGSGPR